MLPHLGMAINGQRNDLQVLTFLSKFLGRRFSFCLIAVMVYLLAVVATWTQNALKANTNVKTQQNISSQKNGVQTGSHLKQTQVMCWNGLVAYPLNTSRSSYVRMNTLFDLG